MYRVFSYAVVAIALLALPASALAQPKKGDKEISISGNVSTSLTPEVQLPFGGGVTGGTSSNGNAFLGFGVFLTDRLQFGVSPFVSIMPGQDGGVDGDVGAGTNLQFYFGSQDSRVKPYLGYSLLISSFKTAEGGSVADNMFNTGVFGVKNYFTERAALDFNMSYGFAVKNPADSQQLDFRIGLTYLF